jgi:hypothetical protein
VKSEKPGPPMPVGNAAAARVRFIVWCLECRYQVEPDPAEMADDTPRGTGSRLAEAARLFPLRSHDADMVVTYTERR